MTTGVLGDVALGLVLVSAGWLVRELVALELARRRHRRMADHRRMIDDFRRGRREPIRIHPDWRRDTYHGRCAARTSAAPTSPRTPSGSPRRG